MSVPVYRRNQSPIEYIDKARKLAYYVFQRVSYFKQRPREVFGYRIQELALEVYTLVVEANGLYYFKRKEIDQTLLNERIFILEKALSKLHALLCAFSLCVELDTKLYISSSNGLKTTKYLTKKVNEEYNLIKGVLTRDKSYITPER